MANSTIGGFMSHHKNMSTKNLNKIENKKMGVSLVHPEINGLAVYLGCQNNVSKKLVCFHIPNMLA